MIMTRIAVTFKEWECILVPRYYSNGRKAISLVSDDDMREPIAVATVNLPEVPMDDDHVAIKDYSENEGMALMLVQNDIVYPMYVKTVQSGYVDIGIHKLTEKGLSLFKA
jgi:hypothetical protein